MSKHAKYVAAKVEQDALPQATRKIATFGWEKLPSGRYLALRFNGDVRVVLTPKRFESDYGESFALTVQRVLEEIQSAVKE